MADTLHGAGRLDDEDKTAERTVKTSVPPQKASIRSDTLYGPPGADADAVAVDTETIEVERVRSEPPRDGEPVPVPPPIPPLAVPSSVHPPVAVASEPPPAASIAPASTAPASIAPASTPPRSLSSNATPSERPMPPVVPGRRQIVTADDTLMGIEPVNEPIGEQFLSKESADVSPSPTPPLALELPEAAAKRSASQRVPVNRSGWLVALGGAWLLTMGVAYALGTGNNEPPVATEPTVVASAPAAEPELPVVASTLLTRAENGDPKALKELSDRPDAALTSEDVLALSRGRRAAKLDEIAVLTHRLRNNPDLMRDGELQLAVRKLAYDTEVSREMLAAVVSLGGPHGPDLLYVLWTATPARTSETKLAEALLRSSDVRASASPSLSVALDLGEAKTCEQVQPALERAIAEGDRRSLVPLQKLKSKTGCGDKGRDDCFPCLRKGDALADAIKAVSKRTSPRY